MDRVLQMLQNACDINNITSFHDYLEACSELRVFYGKGVPVVSIINSKLNENSSREKGLEILKAFLPQSSIDELTANVLLWMQQCLKGLSATEETTVSDLSFDVLQTLFKISSELPEIRKQAANVIIPKFLEAVINGTKSYPENSGTMIKMLQCLETCLIYYGKSCGNTKGPLESFFMTLLESPMNVQIAASRCYLQLCQAGSPHVNCENYKTAWHNQQKHLVVCMHILLDSLFDNVNEIQSSYPCLTINTEKSKVPTVIEKSSLVKIQRLTRQFAGLAQYLKAMLLFSFPVGKSVTPQVILSVLCRTLAVTCETLEKRPSSETVSLMTQIPKLHTLCFTILSALIRCCRVHLVPHASLICKLISQSLKWTTKEEWQYGQVKPYSSIRIAAYDCLSRWVSIARSASLVEVHIYEIKTAILADIKSNRQFVKLNVQKQGQNKGKARKRQRNVSSDNTQEKQHCLVDKFANNRLCSAALKALSHVAEASSTLFKPNIHRELQEEVIRQLLLVQRQPHDMPLPYSDDNCRLELYSALLSLTNNYHSEFPPPIQYANILFRAGYKDRSINVVQLCSLALSCIDKVLRPIFPSLDFPVDIAHDIVTLNPIEKLTPSECRVQRRSQNRRKTHWEILKEAQSVFVETVVESESDSEDIMNPEAEEKLNEETNIVEEVVEIDDDSNDEVIDVSGSVSDTPSIIEEEIIIKDNQGIDSEKTNDGLNVEENDDYVSPMKKQKIDDTDGIEHEETPTAEVTSTAESTPTAEPTPTTEPTPTAEGTEPNSKKMSDDEEEMLHSFVDSVDESLT